MQLIKRRHGRVARDLVDYYHIIVFPNYHIAPIIRC